jgi:hypothetical protein
MSSVRCTSLFRQFDGVFRVTSSMGQFLTCFIFILYIPSDLPSPCLCSKVIHVPSCSKPLWSSCSRCHGKICYTIMHCVYFLVFSVINCCYSANSTVASHNSVLRRVLLSVWGQWELWLPVAAVVTYYDVTPGYDKQRGCARSLYWRMRHSWCRVSWFHRYRTLL